MKTILQLLKKDVHRYAWALLALAVFAGIEIYLYGTSSGFLDNRANKSLSLLTSLIGGVLFFILIVMVVQEETLADPDAYWLARPLARGKLLTEKILFLLILLGIYALSNGTILILNGGTSRVGYVALGIISSLAIWNWQIFLAAQPRSLARYLLLAVSIVVGFYALVFALASFGGFNLGMKLGQLPADTPPHVATMIQSIFWLLIGLGLLRFLYLKRRIRDCWLLLLPAVFGSMLLSPSKSFYGQRFTPFDPENRLKIDHLRTKGTILAMGDESVEVEVVFQPAAKVIKQDVWITFRRGEFESQGKAFKIEVLPTSQRMAKDAEGRHFATLGQIRKGDLDLLGTDPDLDLAFQISFSEQVESGRLDLREGSTYAGDGNRLVLRNLYRYKDQLTVNIAGEIPQLGFERTLENTWNEAFYGHFTFALVGKGGGSPPLDFRISGSHSPFRRQTAMLEKSLAESESLENYEIIVYSRKMTGSGFEFLTEKNVKLVRP